MTSYTILSEPVAEAPPVTKGRGGPWDDVADKVKAQPDTWLRVAEWPKGKAGAASSGVSALRKRGVEAVSRTVDGCPVLYARYQPDAAPKTRKGGVDLTDVAECYVAAVEDGGSGLQAIVETFSVDERAAQKLVREARRDGLLPKAA